MFDRKKKTVEQHNVDHTLIEKVLLVIKERVDKSKRENSETAEEEKFLKILDDFNCKLENKMIEINDNLRMLKTQIEKMK